MRTKTLNAVCLILAFAAVFILSQCFGPGGITIPFFARPVAAHVLVLILTPVFYLPLFALNRHLLKWRLRNGRDIREEEKYESESGFISLKPKDPDRRDNDWPLRP